MRSTADALRVKNAAGASSPLGPLSIFGGRYQLATVASAYGSTGVQIEQLGPDGSTWLNIGSAVTANGVVNNDLPPGQVRFALDASVAGLYLTFVRVPVSE